MPNHSPHFSCLSTINAQRLPSTCESDILQLSTRDEGSSYRPLGSLKSPLLTFDMSSNTGCGSSSCACGNGYVREAHRTVKADLQPTSVLVATVLPAHANAESAFVCSPYMARVTQLHPCDSSRMNKVVANAMVPMMPCNNFPTPSAVE